MPAALSLRQSIISTLAYFDLADFPLTAEEFFVFLWQPPASLPAAQPFGSVAPANSAGKPAINYGEFLNILGKLSLSNKSGYYFLPGREKIVAERQRKFLISEQKLKIAARAAKKIRSVPFLRAIFVCNSVGARQADEESDIDFFIVTDPNRIWIVRFFTNLILRFLGLRTYGQKNKNKICLSFYVDTNHLDLAPLRATEPDVHFAYWALQMTPLFDPDDYYSKFLQANQWIKTHLPNAGLSFQTHGRYLPLTKREREGVAEAGRIARTWKKIWEKMWQGAYGNAIEKQTKEIQLLKMKFSLKEKAKQNNNDVVLADGVLKFHENDTRIEYQEKWRKLCDAVCHAELVSASQESKIDPETSSG